MYSLHLRALVGCAEPEGVVAAFVRFVEASATGAEGSTSNANNSRTTNLLKPRCWVVNRVNRFDYLAW
jgi:hypothetical protein